MTSEHVSIKRRKFLAAGATGAAAASIMPFEFLLHSWDATARITAADFAPHLGDRFRFRRADGSFFARLSEIQPFDDPNRPPHLPRKQAFSLLFDPLQVESPPTQDVYRVAHHRLGSFNSLAVPICREGTLEIIFG